MCKDNKKNDTRTKGRPKKTKSRSPLLLHRLQSLAKESDEGDAEHMTDGNPNTYWHTMYSVTVANCNPCGDNV